MKLMITYKNPKQIKLPLRLVADDEYPVFSRSIVYLQEIISCNCNLHGTEIDTLYHVLQKSIFILHVYFTKETQKVDQTILRLLQSSFNDIKGHAQTKERKKERKKESKKERKNQRKKESKKESNKQKY